MHVSTSPWFVVPRICEFFEGAVISFSVITTNLLAFTRQLTLLTVTNSAFWPIPRNETCAFRFLTSKTKLWELWSIHNTRMIGKMDSQSVCSKWISFLTNFWRSSNLSCPVSYPILRFTGYITWEFLLDWPKFRGFICLCLRISQALSELVPTTVV